MIFLKEVGCFFEGDFIFKGRAQPCTVLMVKPPNHLS